MTTAPIRAILINPTARTVTEIELPTRPGNPEECYGTQPARGALLAAIGCQSIEIFNFDKSNQCVVDGKSLWAETPPTDFWQYGPNCEPIAGIGVITGHEFMTDTWLSTELPLNEVRALVKFTKRIVRGVATETNLEGPVHFRATLVAPIVETE